MQKWDTLWIEAMMLQLMHANNLAESNTGVQLEINYGKCTKLYSGLKLAADISIWMQSGYDGYDVSATLSSNRTIFLLSTI